MVRRATCLSAALAIFLASTAAAQTGTPTAAPRANQERFLNLMVDKLKIDGKDWTFLLPSTSRSEEAKQRDERLKTAIEAQLEQLRKPTTIRVDPRSIAEFSEGQARNLKRMVSNGQELSPACGSAAEAEKALRDATLDLSTADTDEKWRLAVVQVRHGIELLRSAADTSYFLADCDLVAAEKDEVDSIQINAAARDVLLKAALDTGFQPRFGRSDESVSLLPAIAVNTTENAKQVGISAFDYFFSNHWRLYVRSTLTIQSAEEKAEEAAQSSDEVSSPDDVAESVRLALLDPFGGGLNVSGGWFRKVPTPFLKGDANDLNHGVFADVRGGFKFIELPEEKLQLIDKKTRNTPFFSVNTAFRLLLPVFKDAPGTDNPGGVELALTGSVDRVLDTGSSELFAESDGKASIIPRTAASLHLALKLDLPDVASLQISGTLLSTSKFDRRFLIGFGLNRNNRRQEPAETTAPASTGVNAPQ
jgi:hypothetical protein